MPEVESKEKGRVIIEEQRWQQEREGIIYQIEMDDGRLKYNVQIKDVGRPAPFIDQVFSHEESARGLLERVIEQSGGNDQEDTEERSKKGKS